MTVDVVKNIGASVRQRLLNYAKANGRPFAEVLQYYAMERFLYRLSMSPHVETFTLKGALLLTAWQAPISRPTMDIDFLGRTDNAVDIDCHADARDLPTGRRRRRDRHLTRHPSPAKPFEKMPTMPAFAPPLSDEWIAPESTCRSTLDLGM